MVDYYGALVFSRSEALGLRVMTALRDCLILQSQVFFLVFGFAIRAAIVDHAAAILIEAQSHSPRRPSGLNVVGNGNRDNPSTA